MKNFVQDGKTIKLITTKELKSGELVRIGGVLGVSATDVPAQMEAVFTVCGVFYFAADSAFNVGDRVSFDPVTYTFKKDDKGDCIVWIPPENGKVFVKINV